jgi:hypothetical protein
MVDEPALAGGRRPHPLEEGSDLSPETVRDLLKALGRALAEVVRVQSPDLDRDGAIDEEARGRVALRLVDDTLVAAMPQMLVDEFLSWPHPWTCAATPVETRAVGVV